MRIHLTGASGTGTTTVGRALASRLDVPHADTDDFYWVPSDPPYEHKREPAERLRLMHELFVPRPSWVLSGSIMGWGEPLVARIDVVVFLSVAQSTRLERLRAREVSRYGERAIGPGGEREANHREFMAWASGYEDTAFGGRNRASHEAWLKELPGPVLRTDGGRPVEETVAAIVARLPRDSRG